MSCWGKDQQVCCSCRYWTGAREMDFTARHFNALEDEGICQGPSGSFWGMVMGEGSSCSEWAPFKEE